MQRLISALRFLTILPFKSEQAKEEDFSSQVSYFPVIGLILGLLLAGLNLLLTNILPYPLLNSIIIVITLIVITGALHLDGLADTFDALSGTHKRETALKIMRDPHIGTMGVLALICVVLLKVAIIFSLSPQTKPLALIFMCTLSRWSLMMPIYLFNYARDDGKAKIFFKGRQIERFISFALIILFTCLISLGARGLALFTAVTACTYFYNLKIINRLDGVTGDTLGTQVELNEALILMIFILLN